MRIRTGLLATLIVTSLVRAAAAQTSADAAAPGADDTRTQFPAFLANSYFGASVGSMRYLFSGQQLEPGFQVEAVDVPHLAVRVDLFGHEFTKHLAAQVVYMRPARFVEYDNVNGDHVQRQVSTAFGGLTLVGRFPLSDRVSGYGEGGWGITSRSGFDIDHVEALRPAHYGAGLLGAGLAYRASPNIDVLLSATYSPGRHGLHEPSMRLFTTGIRYTMRELPASEVDENRRAGYAFPLNVARLGYTPNTLAYGVNNFFTSTLPIFWGGNVQTRHGLSLDYQRNVFHTKKIFAFDVGASAGIWRSRAEHLGFGTLSAYPLFRFMLKRTDAADYYANYSLAGPTWVSRTVIDSHEIGTHFTFQDSMGAGAFFGKRRRYNAELGIKHYSNGNIFPHNAAIKVPLTLSLGMTF